VIRTTLAVAASALLGCAQAPPAPAPATAPGAEAAPAATLELTGRLSRKGPAETSFWAVTDGSGEVWEIVETTPELEARLARLQNGQVTLRVERKGRLVFERVRVVDVLRPAS
jgi:hypothetical protein